MITEAQTSAPFAPNSWDDGEEWEQIFLSPAGPRNPATTAVAWDDASEWDDIPASSPLAPKEATDLLAKLWIGLFLVYTAAAAPLLVWTLASIAA